MCIYIYTYIDSAPFLTKISPSYHHQASWRCLEPADPAALHKFLEAPYSVCYSRSECQSAPPHRPEKAQSVDTVNQWFRMEMEETI